MSPLALGIMTRHIERDSLPEVAAAIAGYGLTAVQLTLESAGLEPIPATLDRHTAQRIGATLRDAGLTVAAVSGTFNVLDPRPRAAPRLPGPLCAPVRRAPLAGRLGRHHLHRHPRSPFDVGTPSPRTVSRPRGTSLSSRQARWSAWPRAPASPWRSSRKPPTWRAARPRHNVSWRPSIRRIWALRSIRRTSSAPPTCPACARGSATGYGA